MRGDAAVVVLSLVLAGCAGGGIQEPEPGDAVPEAADLSLSKLGARALASPADHRVGEFWLARDPSEPSVVAAAMMDGDDPTGGSICTLMLSEDSGRSWRNITPNGFYTVVGQADPWVTIDSTGTIHAACMEWGGNATTGGTQMVYSRSSDRGRTWSAPMPMAGGDREIIFAASNDVLYWCARAGETDVLASYDGGRNWSHAGTPDAGGANCHSMSEGPDGSLYLAAGGRVLRSSDGGANWIEPQTPRFDHESYHEEKCRPVAQNVPEATLGCYVAFAFMPVPFPIWSHAVDPASGDLFLSFQNLTDQEGLTGRLYHVEMHRSQDLGQTYQRISVPATAERCDGCHASRPYVHVDDEGRLGLVWRQGETGLWWQTWFAASADGGDTWSDPVLLGETGPEDAPIHPGNTLPHEEGAVVNPVLEWAGDPNASDAGIQRLAGGGTEPTWGTRYEGGHYASITSTPEGFLPCWTDLDGGVPQLWCQPVQVGAP